MWKGSPDPGQPLVTKFDNLQFPLVAVPGAVATLPPCNDGHQFREFGLKEESSLDHSLGECWAESVHSHWPLRNTATLRDITPSSRRGCRHVTLSRRLWNQEIHDVLNVFQNTVRSYDNASAAAVHFTFPPSEARRKCTHSSVRRHPAEPMQGPCCYAALLAPLRKHSTKLQSF